MVTERPPLQFGISIDPAVGREDDAFARARIADEHGIDLITVMDHPYLPGLYDAWTLMTALALRTKRVHIGANVLNAPLRPPAMLAKAVATLDRLSGGRVELGIGAGGYREEIVALGGPDAAPGARYAAFKESLEIIRGLWDSTGEPFSYDGQYYRLVGAKFGPVPTRPIPIWTGAVSPRMLRLTGQLADGLLVSSGWVPPAQLPEFNRLIDEGAARSGRPTTVIRRGYNLMGVIDLGDGQRLRPTRPGAVAGDAAHWVETIVALADEHRQDTFTFWPIAGDELAQVEVFAREVVPAVRERRR